MSAPPHKPSPTPSVACFGSNHRPSRSQTGTGANPGPDGVRRARCRCCGLQVMRTAISRRWIIADQLG